MRRVPLIIGLIVIAALMSYEVYEFFISNEGIRYFASEPRRLGYVIIFGVTGGIVALAVSRLSPGSQRALKLTMLGFFGVSLAVLVLLLAYLFASITPTLYDEDGSGGWVVAGLISSVVASCLVWLEFRNLRRNRP